ncbi:hypothetical protein SAMN04488021_1114 [Paracoccus aminovorans]|uniref:VWFA domain-containing protein n=1 Tax=Paracoccus aminovorans TaxID=34004 RepID=A0A1I2ZXC1_9RHOB|nr:hypothetical protein [Paracoccus aminovorans]CQR84375.1 hypothetical protein JCM7685_pAMV3p0430 [Paracoccus aminovorans]SFH41701.1 hypothetical protein SAMN04488021_1114 [Paracoccus aminovorans]
MARRRQAVRPARRSVARRAPRRGLSLPLALGAVAAVALIAGLFLYQQRTAAAMAIDPQTLCPVAGPKAMTAILIDVTDELAPVQAAKLRALVRQRIDAAEVGTEFSLGMVSDDMGRLGSQVALCKPHSGHDVSAINQNLRIVSARYDDDFIKPFNSMFDRMIAASQAKQSPIMEGVQALVSETPGFLTFQGPRRLIVVSDLLQHSGAMSFYRGENWKSFSASRAAQRLSESLGGVEVELFLIPRPADWKGDPAVLEDFWVRYFDHQGASAPRVTRLGDL